MKHFLTLLFTVVSLIGFSQGNGYLGISMKSMPNGGVRISDILEKGAAETHGLLQNDLIYSIDGTTVNTNSELKGIIAKKDWGETISIVFDRDGHTTTKLITLGNRAEKVTYVVKRRKINSEIEWSFDNETWIRIVGGTPIWIKKKDGAETFAVHVIEKKDEVPLFFSDLDDKLEIIEAINERNRDKKVFPSVTVFIKTYPALSKNKVELSEGMSLDVNAFPNPSLGVFTFTIKTKKPESKLVSWQVIDISGKLVEEGLFADFNGNAKKELDLTPNGAGVYLLKIVHSNQVFTERLVVN